MSERRAFMGKGLPYVDTSGLTGCLIVIEGSDGVGRTTQIRLLRGWLEYQGYGVVDTDWTSSPLVSSTIDLAKEGHTMNVWTFNLLYATDFADRLEHEIIPALRAGFVVLSDRYVYTAIARACARGADRAWVRGLFGFALEPDVVFYLEADPETLVRRALLADGLDYWESGLDQNPGLDPYDSFIRYQRRLLQEYSKLAREFGFITIDAVPPIATVQHSLRRHLVPLLTRSSPPNSAPLGDSPGLTLA